MKIIGASFLVLVCSLFLGCAEIKPIQTIQVERVDEPGLLFLQHFQGTKTESGVFKLAWSHVQGVRAYAIYRNGFYLGTINAPGAEYVDGSMQQNMDYEYFILALLDDSKPPAHIDPDK